VKSAAWASVAHVSLSPPLRRPVVPPHPGDAATLSARGRFDPLPCADTVRRIGSPLHGLGQCVRMRRYGFEIGTRGRAPPHLG
jgi:hypothetical protein